MFEEDYPFEIGKANVLREGKDAAVFACGLMAAVILNWNVDLSKTRVEILQREQMQELDNAEEMEQDIQSSSSFEQKGTVYEDPETGKLYVVMPKSGN